MSDIFDLIIYLRANTDTLITRIEKRNREYEKKISAEYLLRLNLLYDRWIDSINDIKVMKIDTVNFNIFKDKDQLNQIFATLGFVGGIHPAHTPSHLYSISSGRKYFQ